jgi:hypothetical protein
LYDEAGSHIGFALRITVRDTGGGIAPEVMDEAELDGIRVLVVSRGATS